MVITHCRTNHLDSPIGYHLGIPVLSWDVEEAAGKRQADAAIRVWQDDKCLLDTGNSADISSLGYKAAITLQPRTRYEWQVTVHSDTGEEAVSGRNPFETGKMDEPWCGKWIRAAESDRQPVFHRMIRPKGKVTRARLYVCGLGVYEARIDGQKVGDEFLTPYCTNYDAWCQVITHDVTGMLKNGGELEIELGSGWYSGRFGFTSRPGQKGFYGNDLRLLAEVRLDYDDGSGECIPTDNSWYVTRSNVTFSNIYDGEHRDDTLPPTPPETVIVLEDPAEKPEDRLSPPVKIQEELKPVELIHTPKGETVLDLGQNQTGIFRLKVREPAGTKIHIQVGEVLQEGCFYRGNLRSALAEYRYVSPGGESVLEPGFTFYGYRYVKIEGIPDLKAEDFTALVLHSDMAETGVIRTGHDKVNRLIDNAAWSMKSNFLDVPTDCPQRDERMGWTGDAGVFSATACRFRDTYAFYRKYLHDMWSEQQALDGMVPQVVPSFGERNTSSVWGDACTVIPWNVYQASGDISILREQYAGMKAWVDWIEREDGENHGWRRHFHYGDWLALDHPALETDTVFGGTDEGFIADIAWMDSTETVAKTAALLGYEEDERKYTALSRKIREALRAEFFTATGRCAIETQTALLLSLQHGLSDEAKLLSQLDRRFAQTKGKLQTGFVGSPILCNTLSEHGRHRLAVDLLLNEEYPGWLYEVNLGATTIWERWNSMNPDGSVSSTGMNSFNHYAYGSVVEWIFRHLAGFSALTPGMKKARISPLPEARLGFTDMHWKGWHIAWQADTPTHLTLDVTVPFDCEAELVLPFSDELPRTLTAGNWHFSYETTEPMKKLLSIDDSLETLLAIPASKEILLQFSKQIEHAPQAPRKQACRIMLREYGADETQISRINDTLKSL